MKFSAVLVVLGAALVAAAPMPQSSDLGSAIESAFGSITGNGEGNSATGNSAAADSNSATATGNGVGSGDSASADGNSATGNSASASASDFLNGSGVGSGDSAAASNFLNGSGNNDSATGNGVLTVDPTVTLPQTISGTVNLIKKAFA